MKNFKLILVVALGVIGLVLWGLDLFDYGLFPFSGWVGFIILIFAGWFGSRMGKAESSNTNLIKLLIMMASSDGELAEEEIQMVKGKAKSLGITDDDFSKIVANVFKEINDGQGQFSFQIPESDTEKKNIARELVKLMKADGTIDENELSFLYSITVKHFGLEKSFVDSLI